LDLSRLFAKHKAEFSSVKIGEVRLGFVRSVGKARSDLGRLGVLISG